MDDRTINLTSLHGVPLSIPVSAITTRTRSGNGTEIGLTEEFASRGIPAKVHREIPQLTNAVIVQEPLSTVEQKITGSPAEGP